MEALIIVPTYNEKENIRNLIDAVLGVVEGIEILIVDDNSPDGTGDIVDSMAEFNDCIHVIHRGEKLGLGSAYITGFKWALENTDTKYVFEMDADFSHDPGSIPQFLEAIRDNDLIIGSRYLEGITVVNWPLSRLILSCGANIYTRIVTGLPLKDSTGGFKCFPRSTLESVNFEDIRSKGFASLYEINYACHRSGKAFREVPITFVERRAGASKLSWKVIAEALIVLLRLRFKGG